MLSSERQSNVYTININGEPETHIESSVIFELLNK